MNGLIKIVDDIYEDQLLALTQTASKSLPRKITIPLWLAAAWKEVGYNPHRGQLKLHQLIQLYRRVLGIAGRRGGKSISVSRGILWPELIRRPETCPINPSTGRRFWPRKCLLLAPTYDQAEIIFDEVIRLLEDRNAKLRIARKSVGRMHVETGEGAVLRAMSAGRPKSARGFDWDVVVADEISHVDDFRIFPEVIFPSLKDRLGVFVGIGSPDYPGSEVHKLALAGLNPDNPYWGYATWTSSENWFIPWMAEEIEAERKSGTPEDIILREYFAKWVARTGLVYPQDVVMDENEIYYVSAAIKKGFGVFYRAIDFGYENPFTCMTHVRIGEVLYCWDEYYQSHKTIDDHALRLAQDDLRFGYELNVPDIEGTSDIAFLVKYTYVSSKGQQRLKGAWVTSGSKPAVVERVDGLRTWMGKKLYRIHPRCVNYIRELSEERYPETSFVRNPTEKPIDTSNHCSSASGYLVYVLKKRINSTRRYIIGEERGSSSILKGY
jgi:hypothetical protein